MSESPLHAHVTAQRDPHDAIYLLVDPLAGCDELAPLAIPRLTQALGTDSAMVVPRADLTHSPNTCPQLIILAQPHQAIDASLIDASFEHARFDATRTKRYVCGWLTSRAAPATLAEGIAERCIVESGGARRQHIPFFEPLRLELLAATSRDDLSGWLGDISTWVLPTSTGNISLLQHTTSAHWPPDDKTLLIQQDVPSVALLLSIWRDALNRPLSYAPDRWTGETVLPPYAAVLAWRQLRDARALGLNRLEDQITLALHRLIMHPRIDEHPRVQTDMAAAVKGKQTLADIFADYSDHTWSNIIRAVTTEG